MSFNGFDLPSMSDQNKTPEEAIKDIKSYLFQLTEQLSYALNNLDEDNFTLQMKDEASAAKDDLMQLLQQGVSSKVNEEEYQQIVNNSEELKRELRAIINMEVDSIVSLAQETYTAKTDTQELKNVLQTKVDQTSSALQAMAERLVTINDETTGVRKSLSLTSEGLDIKAYEDGEESLQSVRIDNDKVSIRHGSGTSAYDVASFSATKAQMPRLEAEESITLQGKNNQAAYQWRTEPNGSLSLVWIDRTNA